MQPHRKHSSYPHACSVGEMLLHPKDTFAYNDEDELNFPDSSSAGSGDGKQEAPTAITEEDEVETSSSPFKTWIGKLVSFVQVLFRKTLEYVTKQEHWNRIKGAALPMSTLLNVVLIAYLLRGSGGTGFVVPSSTLQANVKVHVETLSKGILLSSVNSNMIRELVEERMKKVLPAETLANFRLGD